MPCLSPTGRACFQDTRGPRGDISLWTPRPRMSRAFNRRARPTLSPLEHPAGLLRAGEESGSISLSGNAYTLSLVCPSGGAWGTPCPPLLVCLKLGEKQQSHCGSHSSTVAIECSGTANRVPLRWLHHGKAKFSMRAGTPGSSTEGIVQTGPYTFKQNQT